MGGRVSTRQACRRRRATRREKQTTKNRSLEVGSGTRGGKEPRRTLMMRLNSWLISAWKANVSVSSAMIDVGCVVGGAVKAVRGSDSPEAARSVENREKSVNASRVFVFAATRVFYDFACTHSSSWAGRPQRLSAYHVSNDFYAMRQFSATRGRPAVALLPVDPREQIRLGGAKEWRLGWAPFVKRLLAPFHSVLRRPRRRCGTP